MLKKFWLFLFVSCFISTSFSQSTNDSYYPLKLNFEWKYYNEYFPQSEKIIDTVRINGRLYYNLSPYENGGGYLLAGNNDQVFIYNTKDSSEYLLYDFTASVGESWELPDDYDCSFGIKITLVGKSDTVITPAGTYYNCYHFSHQPNCADAGTMESWFAKGIGKVKFEEESISGIRRFVLSDLITFVDNNAQKDFSYRLFQNYPNPFNPSTNIDFSVSASGKVTIKVFDILGKEIKTLLDEYKESGRYHITFDGTNLPSGIYFYKITANNFSSTKKMVLIK